MRLHRETEYALRALIFLAQRPKGTVYSAPEIAEVLGISAGFLSKIFQRLLGHGLVRSHRGRHRGYSLARPGGKIALREILESIEGADLFERCLFWEDRCGDRDPCLLHRDWSQIKPRLLARLERKTLADLTRGEKPSI
ncbi:MAG: RrF2 family transcriptional regulator [Candidatus Methylomirabilales bacterium]